MYLWPCTDSGVHHCLWDSRQRVEYYPSCWRHARWTVMKHAGIPKKQLYTHTRVQREEWEKRSRLRRVERYRHCTIVGCMDGMIWNGRLCGTCCCFVVPFRSCSHCRHPGRVNHLGLTRLVHEDCKASDSLTIVSIFSYLSWPRKELLALWHLYSQAVLGSQGSQKRMQACALNCIERNSIQG